MRATSHRATGAVRTASCEGRRRSRTAVTQNRHPHSRRTKCRGPLAGDVTQVVDGAGTGNQRFDDAGRLTTLSDASNATTAALSYDNEGDRTAIDSVSAADSAFAYDQASQLTAYTGPAAGGATISQSYGYDADGLRRYVDDGTDRTYEAWDTSTDVASMIEDGDTSYIYGPADTPIEQVTAAGSATYYHADQLGSTRALTDQAGHAVATYSYSPYGTPTSSTGTVSNPFGFAGQYTDATGLQYLRARYYDPSSAQFLTRDPLSAISQAPYGYANGDPVDNSDPTGLLCVPFAGCVHSQDIADAAAGFGDSVTFGATEWARRKIHGDNVNYCSSSYTAGGVAGTAAAILIPGEGEAETLGQAAKGAEEASAAAEVAAEGAGDLTAAERQQIQDVVDRAGRPIEVVGSAARGERGPGSDIDYTAPNSSHPYLQPHAGDLPGLDPTHGILHGGADPLQGPPIRFEPRH